MNEMPVYQTKVLEKGTREEHAFPATRPAQRIRRKFGKIGLVVVVGLQQSSLVWWAPFVCVFCLLLSAH
jgi:hypothetical protein